jgi:putative membrane protein
MQTRSSFRRDRFKAICLLIFAVLTGLSCVNVPNTEYLALQHVPTVIAIVLLCVLDGKWPLDRTSFAFALAILTLHLLGARYLYSYVPYDRWGRAWFGFSIQEYFGWERNHYDRLVHLLYGIMMGAVLVRWLPQHFLRKPYWSRILALDIVLSTSALYELLEGMIAMLMAGDWAESFNGQQGDIWDAHKDMALAFAGSVLAVIFTPPFLFKKSDSHTT